MKFNYGYRCLSAVVSWLAVITLASAVHSQERGQALSGGPGVGDSMPDVQVYLADGTPFSTGQLKGSYTVLVFGCLT